MNKARLKPNLFKHCPLKNGKFDGANLKPLGVKFCGAGKSRRIKPNLNLAGPQSVKFNRQSQVTPEFYPQKPQKGKIVNDYLKNNLNI